MLAKQSMLSTSRDGQRIDSQITADNYTFNAVKKFIYLGSTVTTNNDVNTEIKRRITLANRRRYGLNKQLNNRELSRTTKLILYKTLILPMLLYGAEAWTLLSTNVAALRVFGRKVLRQIFGPVRVADDFRIRYNSELYKLLNDMDVVQRINIQWLRYVFRGCFGEVGICCGELRKSAKRATLYSLKGPNRGNSVIRSRGAWKDV